MSGVKDGVSEAKGCAAGSSESPKTGCLHAVKCIYMLGFNVICSCAWANVFALLVAHTLKHKVTGVLTVSVWPEIAEPLFFAQSLAVLEILHALVGLVRSSVPTTVMQVFSRLQLVWFLFPSVAASRESVALLTCAAAWSCAELLRFPFFGVQQLLQIVDLFRGSSAPLEVPELLKWLRYSGFTVLYPIGITSEVVCIFSSLSTLRTSTVSTHYPYPMPNQLNFEINLYFTYIVLLILYVPGSVQLYGHMLKQRKKYLYGVGQEAATKKKA